MARNYQNIPLWTVFLNIHLTNPLRKSTTQQINKSRNKLERKTRLELATPTLARSCSTNWAISAIVLFPGTISTLCLAPQMVVQKYKPFSILQNPRCFFWEVSRRQAVRQVKKQKRQQQPHQGKYLLKQRHLTFCRFHGFIPCKHRAQVPGVLPHDGISNNPGQMQ